MENLFLGVFDNTAAVVSVTDFLICIGVALVMGLALAWSYTFRTRYTKSFVITLAMIPAVVCIVIMMVNGNIGAGVAVAGAFSLVRFRSVPGSAKEICAIFLAMGTGLISGMGYLGYAVLFTVIMCAALVGYSAIDLGERKNSANEKQLTVVIPEDLNYTRIFDDVFDEFTSFHTLVKVKTTNMGSMFKLTYTVTLRDPVREKDMIDALRCRNGNLEISLSSRTFDTTEL